GGTLTASPTEIPPLRVGAARVAGPELNSLSERKLARKVNRVGLAAHVTLPGTPAAPAPAAGIFLTAECAPDLRAARAGIHVRDPAIAPDRAHEFLRLAHVVRKNGTGQTLRNAVLDRDRFIEIPISQQVEEWS